MNRKQKIKLFCIPYAGGLATMFYKWKPYLSNLIDLVVLELKGRLSRSSEDFSDSMEDVVEDLFEIIRDDILYNDYVIFGHSMGSTIAYELAQKIQQTNYPAPLHLIFSGRLPPEFNDFMPKIHNAPLEKFKSDIISLGGTSVEIFENEILSKLFIPILRADYKVLEDYNYKKYENKLFCNISVFYGSEDDRANIELLQKWKTYTYYKTKFYCFNGNHFYINSCAKEVSETINKIIASLLP